jgi:hypothetical protein
VTLAELVDAGWTPERVCGLLASSLGLAASAEPVRPATLVEHLNPETLIASLPTTEWVVDPAAFS